MKKFLLPHVEKSPIDPIHVVNVAKSLNEQEGEEEEEERRRRKKRRRKRKKRGGKRGGGGESGRNRLFLCSKLCYPTRLLLNAVLLNKVLRSYWTVVVDPISSAPPFFFNFLNYWENRSSLCFLPSRGRSAKVQKSCENCVQ